MYGNGSAYDGCGAGDGLKTRVRRVALWFAPWFDPVLRRPLISRHSRGHNEWSIKAVYLKHLDLDQHDVILNLKYLMKLLTRRRSLLINSTTLIIV